jgi:ribosomal protein S18 acetylase RimI-like enzyme
MSDVISIGEATEADLAAVGSLLAELVDATQDRRSFEVSKAAENYRVLFNNANSSLLVAKAEHSVVGFINFTTRRTALHPGLCGLIDELVVAEEYRHRGIGKRLVAAAVDKCRQLGCREVEVSTEKTNLQARQFYKDCGFEEDAVLLEMHL